MLIKRTLPPAATPIQVRDIFNGLRGLTRSRHEIERFRSELQSYFGVKHSFLVSSGKAALTLIFKALQERYPEKGAVVIPAYTCYSVPSAVRRAGLEIKLCDIDADTLDFDYAQLEKILSGPDAERILAIVPRHFFGVPADMERLRRVTSGSEIAIVEDAAQVMGGEQKGKKLGTMGDVGVFSLGRGKALSTVEGGIILTDRDSLADRIKRSVDHLEEYTITESLSLLLNAVFLAIFMHPLLFWFPKSLPFLKVGATIYDTGFPIRRLSAFQAGLSYGWQDRLQLLMKIRTGNARYWSSCLKDIPALAKLFSQGRAGNAGDAPVRFPVLIRKEIEAKRLLRESEAKGLGIMMTYPDSVDGIPELSLQIEGRRFPVAREYAKNLLTFPTHNFVLDIDKRRIVQILNSSSARA
jgi:dTDP-4-amino-4,6-dideoxygalactose transaminase